MIINDYGKLIAINKETGTQTWLMGPIWVSAIGKNIMHDEIKITELNRKITELTKEIEELKQIILEKE